MADRKSVNLRSAQSLVFASEAAPGRVFTAFGPAPSESSAQVEGTLAEILAPQAVVLSVRSNQGVDAFVEDRDDGFEMSPDHRLTLLNSRPTSELITGVIPLSGAKGCEVTTVWVKIAQPQAGAGVNVVEYEFQLRGIDLSAEADSCKDDDEALAALPVPIRAIDFGRFHSPPDMQLTNSQHGTPSVLDMGQFLGLLHAETCLREVEREGYFSGHDLHFLKQDLALQYGLVSPEASLVMLYTEEQFSENELAPPQNHPVYEFWRAKHGLTYNKTMSERRSKRAAAIDARVRAAAEAFDGHTGLGACDQDDSIHVDDDDDNEYNEVGGGGGGGGERGGQGRFRPRGSIGQRKTEEQLHAVRTLAERLRTYMREPSGWRSGPEPLTREEVEIMESAGGGGGGEGGGRRGMSTTGLRQIQGLFGGAEGGRRDLGRGYIDEDDEERVRGYMDLEIVEEMTMSLESATCDIMLECNMSLGLESRMGVDAELENELDALEEQLALETLAEQVS